MFDFTTETVINSLANNKAVILTSAEDPSIPAGEDLLFIKQVGRFPEETSDSGTITKAIYKTVGTNPVNEVYTIDLAALDAAALADLAGTVIRLDLDVRLSGSNDGAYSRWAVNKGEPFYVEFFVEQAYANATALVADAVPVFNKGIAKEGNRQLDITASGATIVVTATTEYQRIVDGKVVKIDFAYDDFATVLATGAVTTPGSAGFGTAWFITTNLRLPTIENIRFGGTNQDERPIEGELYNQYTLVLESERNITGDAAVGEKLTSVTRHVIYLRASLSAQFDLLLADIGTIVDPRA